MLGTGLSRAIVKASTTLSTEAWRGDEVVRLRHLAAPMNSTPARKIVNAGQFGIVINKIMPPMIAKMRAEIRRKQRFLKAGSLLQKKRRDPIADANQTGK